MNNNETKIHTVNLPDIGEGVVEGEVIEWLKQIGDELKQDEPVVIVMTDKATVELPSPYPGTLKKQYFQPGEIAIKDKPLYDIEIAGKENKIDSIEIQHAKKSRTEKCSKDTSISHQRNESEGKVLATPATRHLAKEIGIDINTIVGTGPEGRVTNKDLIQGKDKKNIAGPSYLDDEIRPLVGIRKLMAEKMALSKSKAAHFSYFEQLDATRLVKLRTHFNLEGIKEGIKVTYMPFLIKALSMTLKKFPEVNSTLDSTGSNLIIHKQHNIGIAMTTELGLIVPVLYGVQDMTLNEIAKEFESLKKDALSHKLKPEKMKGSTITISNFGVLGGGGMWATPVINYPEMAILAVAKIQKQPMVSNGELVVRDALNLSWSFDHRVIDGDLVANFSHHYAMLLQNPAPLL